MGKNTNGWGISFAIDHRSERQNIFHSLLRCASSSKAHDVIKAKKIRKTR
jgi:hypothetical protein